MGGRALEQIRPAGDTVQLDQAVVTKLPPNCRILAVQRVGKKDWSTAVKIVVQLEDGRAAEFFKKEASGSVGAIMMEGACEAERALHGFVPDLVSRPVAWGTYNDDPNTHYYMCEFVEMHDEIPRPNAWARAAAKLHRNSMGRSPTGEFGFHATTHLSNVPLNNAWNRSWAAFWAQQMKDLFDREESVRGPDDVLAGLRAGYFEKAIPRYLGALESEGRSVTPCLVHSNLWPGNIKPNSSTDELCMFDSCAYWGHNEADLAVCRNPRYKLRQACIKAYRACAPELVSEPSSDFDARNAVYALKYHVLLSIMYPGDEFFRETLIRELEILQEKLDSERSNGENHQEETSPMSQDVRI